jgi:hypothetical protein
LQKKKRGKVGIGRLPGVGTAEARDPQGNSEGGGVCEGRQERQERGKREAAEQKEELEVREARKQERHESKREANTCMSVSRKMLKMC